MKNQLKNKNDNVNHVLNEINQRAPYFFTNTNDLLNKARLFSTTYLTSNENDLRFIDDELTQRFFSLDFIENENQEIQQTK
ncbi:MAG TPA: hypothetical protein ACHBZA_08460 [Arsenophonus apicola]|nr:MULTISPECIES: hypothetical protein [Arsenophonus]UBX30942.1 hypothetical protein LDL57_17215 [Arsenophonus apicola]